MFTPSSSSSLTVSVEVPSTAFIVLFSLLASNVFVDHSLQIAFFIVVADIIPSNSSSANSSCGTSYMLLMLFLMMKCAQFPLFSSSIFVQLVQSNWSSLFLPPSLYSWYNWIGLFDLRAQLAGFGDNDGFPVAPLFVILTLLPFFALVQ